MCELNIVHDSKEIRNMILDNPDLPIVFFAGENCGSFYYWTHCSSVNCELGEVLDCEQDIDKEKIYCDRDEFKSDVEDFLYYETEECSDEEYKHRLENELKKYEPYWKSCILVYVDN